MCDSIDEGGQRCADSARLEKLSAAELAPSTEGAPDLDWANDDLSKLWDAYSRAEVCAAIETVEGAATCDARTFVDMGSAATFAGGQLYGAAFRIKSPGSLARKIGAKQETAESAGARPKDPKDVASTITDVTRYTILSADHDQIVPTATRAVEALEAHGWHVIEVEQSYLPGNSYKGLHLLVRHDDGQVAELQIHSELSQKLKDLAHPLYEISRDPSRNLMERRDARQQTREIYQDLPAPAGLDMLDLIGVISVRKKTYT